MLLEGKGGGELPTPTVFIPSQVCESGRGTVPREGALQGPVVGSPPCPRAGVTLWLVDCQGPRRTVAASEGTELSGYALRGGTEDGLGT